MKIDDYFDRVFVINLDRRTDRWKESQAQLNRLGTTKAIRFSAYENVIGVRGQPSGIFGCNASHRAILDIIAFNRWNRVLVLEDDFHVVHNDFISRFDAMSDQVPNEWDMLYLGCSYANRPLRRISPILIQAGRLHGTSSYGITWQFARKISPYIRTEDGQIDSQFNYFLPNSKCYVFQPRLIIQRPGYSDLQKEHTDNTMAMQDTAHESLV